MKHPRGRAHRRFAREVFIARRRNVELNVWRYSFRAPDFPWGVYAKWNMGCGSPMCHYAKYLSYKRKRRVGRRTSESPVECRKRDRIIED